MYSLNCYKKAQNGNNIIHYQIISLFNRQYLHYLTFCGTQAKVSHTVHGVNDNELKKEINIHYRHFLLKDTHNWSNVINTKYITDYKIKPNFVIKTHKNKYDVTLS